ncbi:MAG: pilus assembly protein PilX [Gammaproteobacteria bacterium]|nr:MAG: pilus assembly protein PilX [Gammaproteobacteria bacterium]TLZ59995.1 MAG: pilus assembly protein PilX [Gammaproteobacteria bacterium]
MNARVRLGIRSLLGRRERGMALITSLLLLLIITILALSMFRGFGSQEKIASNLREKARAVHAAESAQQYAEWWLLQGNNAAIGSGTCSAPLLNANLGQGEICNQPLASAVDVPWNIGVTYTLPNMNVTPANAPLTVNVSNEPYYAAPGFYIEDLGIAADLAGEAYRIDAYGYGGSATTVAIVESTYEVSQGIVCLSCQ